MQEPARHCECRTRFHDANLKVVSSLSCWPPPPYTDAPKKFRYRVYYCHCCSQQVFQYPRTNVHDMIFRRRCPVELHTCLSIRAPCSHRRSASLVTSTPHCTLALVVCRTRWTHFVLACVAKKRETFSFESHNLHKCCKCLFSPLFTIGGVVFVVAVVVVVVAGDASLS